MQSDSSLCSAILSALENLRLTELQFTEHISIFTSSLASVSLDDLPLVVGFIIFYYIIFSVLTILCSLLICGGRS